MVKYSKYLLTLIGLVVTLNASGQSNGRFSALNRDLEVTRVTLDNYLKKWDGEVMLNQFSDVKADYVKGQGVKINIEARNADIYMSVHNGSFKNGDHTILDTFFSDQMVSLQKERLVNTLKSFFQDFKSYLPKLENGEKVIISFDVKDKIRKNRQGKQLDPSPMAHKRTYTLAAEVSASDLENYKSGSLSTEAFNQNMKINLNNN